MRHPRQVSASDAYEILIQSVVDYAIYMLDAEGHVASWNPGAQRIKGYTVDEIIGSHFSAFYTPEDRAAGVPERALRTAAETGRFSAEGWRQRKDGTRFWAMVVIDAIRVHGNLIGFAKITRDMTEQRAAQAAARESERRFRLLVQGVTDYAIFMLDPSGYVTNWNGGAQRIKGYSEQEIVGKHFSSFYTEEDRARGVPTTALETARHTGRYEAEGWRVRKDGTRFWANVVIDAIYDGPELIGFGKVTRDLTERRKAELALEQSREALFQSQKMDSVGQLTGGLAHDFNNLLTGIIGGLELVQTRVAQGRLENLDRYVTGALENANRAASLTHRLLAFARRQTLDPKPTQVNRLVASMEELIRGTVGPAVAVQAKLATELWPTLCDPNQLENALLNLCINARDAMPEGGQLVIETTAHAAQCQNAEIAAGDYICVSVADTGAGMSEDVVKRACEPFFTTKPLGRGTGLGLSMVYGFARQSGGQVRITSEVGSGTTVRIYLPRHTGPEQEQEHSERQDDAPRAEPGQTVLVVDDEPSVRMLVTEVLQDLGYTAIESGDGASALRLLQSDRQIDLVITDIGLPGELNGRQLADAALTLRPRLKILLITGYAESAMLDGGQVGRDMRVIAKPFALDALASEINAALATAPG